MRNENFSAELRIKEETLLAKNPKEGNNSVKNQKRKQLKK